jgi:hypothetical protein
MGAGPTVTPDKALFRVIVPAFPQHGKFSSA